MSSLKIQDLDRKEVSIRDLRRKETTSITGGSCQSVEFVNGELVCNPTPPRLFFDEEGNITDGAILDGSNIISKYYF